MRHHGKKLTRKTKMRIRSYLHNSVHPSKPDTTVMSDAVQRSVDVGETRTPQSNCPA